MPKKRRPVGFKFHARSLGFLRAARWAPARRVPIAPYVDAYALEHLEIHAAARRFLESFGGLIIAYRTIEQQEDVLSFCADEVVRGMGDGGLANLEARLQNHPLCPVGQFEGGTCMLIQDAGGGIAGVSDDLIFRIGDNGEEAINNILTMREFNVIAADPYRRWSQGDY